MNSHGAFAQGRLSGDGCCPYGEAALPDLPNQLPDHFSGVWLESVVPACIETALVQRGGKKPCAVSRLSKAGVASQLDIGTEPTVRTEESGPVAELLLRIGPAEIEEPSQARRLEGLAPERFEYLSRRATDDESHDAEIWRKRLPLIHLVLVEEGSDESEPLLPDDLLTSTLRVDLDPKDALELNVRG